MTYVCTEKATMNEWLKEIEDLKKENAYQRTIIDDINAEFHSKVKECKKLEKENNQLKKRVETLEMRLDTKEQLNEEYRKQIDKLRTDNIYEE